MKFKQCDNCNGSGMLTKRNYLNDCYSCAGTGYQSRFVQKPILWYWRNFRPELMPHFGEYDQWSSLLFPPPIWGCRECNGLGYDPYHYDCEACAGTGVRWRLVYWLRMIIYFPIRYYKNWKREREHVRPLSEVDIPF